MLNISPRFVLWIMVISILLAALLHSGSKLEKATTETAYSVAIKRILDRANQYKENWVLHNHPASLIIDDQPIYFTDEGWPIPYNNEQIDCQHWLILLNESEEVFGHRFESQLLMQSDNDYVCAYYSKDRDAILIKALKRQFSVELNLFSE